MSIYIYISISLAPSQNKGENYNYLKQNGERKNAHAHKIGVHIDAGVYGMGVKHMDAVHRTIRACAGGRKQ